MPEEGTEKPTLLGPCRANGHLPAEEFASNWTGRRGTYLDTTRSSKLATGVRYTPYGASIASRGKKVKSQYRYRLRYDTRCCFNVRSKADLVSLIYRIKDFFKNMLKQLLS